jgi:phosphatidylinositol kinase/protein kinase (PI-3  family)
MLLTRLVGATKRLIKSYAVPMLRVLLTKADDPNVTVASNVVLCLGELASAGGEEVLPHVPELMQLIIPRLGDSSLPKRDAALVTLGNVCASTGYVIDPLIDYPQLVKLLGKILKTEQRASIRREVIKVFGILGALDPYRRKVHNLIISPRGNKLTCCRSASRWRMARIRESMRSMQYPRLLLPYRLPRTSTSKLLSSQHCSVYSRTRQ